MELNIVCQYTFISHFEVKSGDFSFLSLPLNPGILHLYLSLTALSLKRFSLLFLRWSVCDNSL